MNGVETGTFRPSQEWLEHVRLSSVRYGQSCSASFVSPQGLVMTNHHCARSCVEAVSTSTVDYVENGFTELLAELLGESG